MEQKLVLSIFLFSFVYLFLSENSKAQISNDAVLLTLRKQEGIFLDSMMARSIDSSLTEARTVNDSLSFINIHPGYINKTIVISTSASWCEAWKRGEILTGQPNIDSLSTRYGLIQVQYLYISSPWFYLTYKYPLQLQKLSLLYQACQGVTLAYPNSITGDGNNIVFKQKNGVDNLAFSLGSGDCPMGCMERFYWYVSIDRSESQRKAILEESRNESGVILYRWNIPSFYAMTMFPSVDSILTTVQHAPDWWVRRHAIEGIKRFFVNSSPWFFEDDYNRWNLLRSDLIARKSEVQSVIELAKFDSDPDVQASANTALPYIVSVDVTSSAQPLSFELLPNYPNPFNPRTQIQFKLTHHSFISLKVFNLVGQEVALLVNAMLTEGTHIVTWDASAFASGVYFYQLRSDETVKLGKMILLK